MVAAPPQHLIKLDFRDYFRIEHSTNCMNDYLEIRDGPHGYNKVIERPFCGKDAFPPLITSSDRHLWIHFKSDDNIEDKGFKAIYEYIPRPPSRKYISYYFPSYTKTQNFISSKNSGRSIKGNRCLAI